MQDKLCLQSFFDRKEYKENRKLFFKLRNRWLSTNEIKIELHEYANRTKRRLEKLKELELVHKKTDKRGKRVDNCWYLTHSGMYYILSTFEDNKKKKKFIYTNRAKSHLVLLLKNTITTKKLELFVDDIKKCVKKQQYEKIMDVVRSFIQGIEERYVDWTFELEPNSSTKIHNPLTGKSEIY